MRPQSTARRSSPDSSSIMLRPISPRPPSGRMRTEGSIAGSPGAPVAMGAGTTRSVIPGGSLSRGLGTPQKSPPRVLCGANMARSRAEIATMASSVGPSLQRPADARSIAEPRQQARVADRRAHAVHASPRDGEHGRGVVPPAQGGMQARHGELRLPGLGGMVDRSDQAQRLGQGAPSIVPAMLQPRDLPEESEDAGQIFP